METAEIINDHERRIAYIEGRLDSLATKELVLQLNAELLKELTVKIDQQTVDLRAEISGMRGEIGEIRDEIQTLDNRITDQDKKYTKLAGAAVAIGLILSLLVGLANVLVALVNAGLLQIP